MIDSYVSRFFTFSGAGNDFVVLDGRRGGMEPFREPARIGALCREYHTDGLMILTSAPTPAQSGEGSVRACHAERSPKGEVEASPYDFVMEFYNPDGSGGMMCGNGGRCIVAFANYLGINPADGRTYHFLAPDGEHTAEILSEGSDLSKPSLRDPSHSQRAEARLWAPPSYTAEGGHGFGEVTPLRTWTVRLKMIDVQGVTSMKDGYFLNTGTRHFVKFTPGVDGIDMETEAKPLRWDAAFQPEGTNVNFVEVRADGLHVRTFEKGVEGETLACGTGLTACALAAYKAGVAIPRGEVSTPAAEGGTCHDGSGAAVSYRLQCRRGDWLQVDFQSAAEDRFTDVYLTGPAELVTVNRLK